MGKKCPGEKIIKIRGGSGGKGGSPGEGKDCSNFVTIERRGAESGSGRKSEYSQKKATWAGKEGEPIGGGTGGEENWRSSRKETSERYNMGNGRETSSL